MGNGGGLATPVIAPTRHAGSRYGRENELACPMVLCLEAAPKNVGANMAKKVKRREWTKDDVRELETLARQKTPVAKIAKSLKRTPEIGRAHV